MRPAVRARVRLSVVALVCSMTAQACGAMADGGIVLAGPMSGAYAATGIAMRHATATRLKELAPLIVTDDRCQADGAIEVARWVVAMKPSIVIGHPCSSAAIAAAPIYAAAQIPFVATGARYGDLTDKRAGPLVFRLSGRDDRQGADAAAFLAHASGGRPIAILHDRTFEMSTIAAEATAALTGPSGKPPLHKVMQFPFVASELNYDALVAKVTAFAEKPEAVGAVFFAGFPAEAIVVLKTLRARGVTAPFLGVDALATEELGAMVTATMDEVRVLVSTDQQSAAVWASAAVGVWQSATKANGANPGAAIANIAYEDPALGRITFDAKGDAVIPSYLVCAWRDGAWRPVAASEADKIPRP